MPDWGSIEFKWPFMLWAMTLWPLWLVWRAWRHRRSQRMASSWLTGSPTPIGLLFIEALSLALLLLALARPQAVLLQAMRDAAVILVIDSSASMKADDVKPNRLEAARQAAHHFIETKPGLLQVGIVSVGGTAALAQVPTLEREDLRRALDDLGWQNGSALGTGLLIALDTLLPQAGIETQKIIDAAAENPRAAAPNPSQPPVAKNPSDPPQDPRERITSDGRSKAIVLITDGQGNAVSWSSAGTMGFKGSRKSTPYAAQVTADLCAREGMEHGLQKVEVLLKGPGSGRETAMRSLQAAGLEIIGVRDVSPQAHNGCRARKRRRV